MRCFLSAARFELGPWRLKASHPPSCLQGLEGPDRGQDTRSSVPSRVELGPGRLGFPAGECDLGQGRGVHLPISVVCLSEGPEPWGLRAQQAGALSRHRHRLWSFCLRPGGQGRRRGLHWSALKLLTGSPRGTALLLSLSLSGSALGAPPLECPLGPSKPSLGLGSGSAVTGTAALNPRRPLVQSFSFNKWSTRCRASAPEAPVPLQGSP